MDFKAFIAWLFTPEPPQPIENLEDKRKAVERFCLAQNHSCGRCNIATKQDFGASCFLTDEDIERTYKIIYGQADPKIINGGENDGNTVSL